jgi:hypothetical protein
MGQAPGGAGAVADAGHAFCVDPMFRQSYLEAAGPEGDRIVVCVRPEAKDPEGGPPARSCVELRSTGDYGAAADAVPVEPRVASVPYRQVSRDGRLRFEIHGGVKIPHGAVAVLRDAPSGRVLQRAPMQYDENVEALGWIGQDVVLRLRVEEGPGCVLMWLDPRRVWPISMLTYEDDAGRSPIDCFDGNLVLTPSEGTFVIVGAGGEEVTFIDEATMAVDTVTTGRSSGPEMGRRLSTWIEGDGVLVLAYGAAESGTVARIDLKQRRLLGVWAPPVCAGSTSAPLGALPSAEVAN